MEALRVPIKNQRFQLLSLFAEGKGCFTLHIHMRFAAADMSMLLGSWISMSAVDLLLPRCVQAISQAHIFPKTKQPAMTESRSSYFEKQIQTAELSSYHKLLTCIYIYILIYILYIYTYDKI